MPFDIRELIQTMSMANISISEFRGSDREDAVKWINQYERLTRLWTDSARVEQVRSFLDSTAEYWFDDKIKPNLATTTFADFKQLFLKKYLPTDKREFAIKRLKAMSYNIQDHRVTNFITDYKHWKKIVNPEVDEKQLISDLLDRFPVSFQCKLLNISSIEDIKDLDMFTELAVRVEKVCKMKQSEKNSCMSAKVNSVNDKMVESVAELVNVVKELRKEVQDMKDEKKKKSKKECFKCKGDWPSCGCTSKCKFCNGNFPQCKCRNKQNPRLVDQSGNAKGPQV